MSTSVTQSERGREPRKVVGGRTGEMFKNGLLIDLDRLRLADLRAFTHLPVAITQHLQSWANGVLQFW